MRRIRTLFPRLHALRVDARGLSNTRILTDAWKAAGSQRRWSLLGRVRDCARRLRLLFEEVHTAGGRGEVWFELEEPAIILLEVVETLGPGARKDDALPEDCGRIHAIVTRATNNAFIENLEDFDPRDAICRYASTFKSPPDKLYARGYPRRKCATMSGGAQRVFTTTKT